MTLFSSLGSRARLAALFAFAMSIASVAQASPADEARFFDEDARAAFARRDYVRALESFLFAYEITPTPGLLYNLAVCAELARRPEDAYAYFERYLAQTDSDASRRADAERRMTALRRRLALLHVVSTPARATIYVDREELGNYGETERTIVVEPGERRVLLEREGYADASATATAVVGQTVDVAVTLEPILGRIVVRGEPANATVEFEQRGQVVGTGAMREAALLPIGDYQIRVSAPGFHARLLEANVRRDEETTVDASLRPELQATGRLLVRTRGVRGRVTIDGRLRGTAPLVIERLAIGSHRVSIRAPGHQMVMRDITIEEGRTLNLDVELLRVAGEDDE